MAGPLLIAGAALSVVGGLMNAYSQVEAQRQLKATTKYNQAILDANNRIDAALTDMDIRRIRREGESLLGTQRAMVGKSGTKFSGSNIDVFMDTVKDIEMDVITMEIGKSARGAQTRQQKTLLAMDLAAGKKALPMKVASSVLGGATQAAGMLGGK